MAAYFNNSADRLYATLTTGVDRTKYILIYLHGKWETGQSHNSVNVPVRLGNSSGFWLQISSNATPIIRAQTSTGANSDGGTTWSDNTWYGFGAVFEPDDATKSKKPYIDGSADGTLGGNGDFSTNAADYDEISVGQYSGGTNYTRWKGWLAELSVWECDSEATANSVVTSLATTKASGVTVSGATRIDYWDLIADVNSDDAGDNLTNSGSVTFDAEDPGLSGGGGGGSTAQVIGFSVI